MTELDDDGRINAALSQAWLATQQMMAHKSYLVEWQPHTTVPQDNTTALYQHIMELATRSTRGAWMYDENPDRVWNVSLNNVSSSLHAMEERVYKHCVQPEDEISLPNPSLSMRNTLPNEGYFITTHVAQHNTFFVIAGWLHTANMLDSTLMPIYTQYFDMLKTLDQLDMTAYGGTSVSRDMKGIFVLHVVGSLHRAIEHMEYDPDVPFDWQSALFCDTYRTVLHDGMFQHLFTEFVQAQTKRLEMLQSGGVRMMLPRQ